MITVTFGRFSPPTKGHAALFAEIMKMGKHLVVASRTFDKKKNPVPVEEKVAYIKKAMPRLNIVAAGPTTRTIIEVLKSLDGKEKEVRVIVGSDRIANFRDLLNKYNGKEYNFKKIEVVDIARVGSSETDLDGVSATKLRQTAIDGDFGKFKQLVIPGLKEADMKKLYDTVRGNMGIKEDVDIDLDEQDDEEVTWDDTDFADYEFTDEDPEFDVAELDLDVDNIDWEDVLDMYDPNELAYPDMPYEQVVDEANISVAQRMKKKLTMRRFKKKIAVARKIKLKRASNLGTIKNRAVRKARQIVTKRILRGRDKSKMSAAEKSAIEARVKRMGALVKRTATRLVPTMRKIERTRLSR
jgi:nicotinic acid mononucleotide adenylyltransferase